MKLMRQLIAASAVLAAMSIAALAESAKQPDAGGNRTLSQGDPGQAGKAGEAQDQGQAQPQGPTGPLNTSSGGTPASSPQGETPAGMQTPPQGSSGQTVQGDPSGR